MRTRDLPLYDPPGVRLRSEWDGEGVAVRIEGVSASIGTRWSARGTITGEGDSIRWQPEDAEDQLSVAVRTTGGVAIAQLRASRLAPPSK